MDPASGDLRKRRPPGLNGPIVDEPREVIRQLPRVAYRSAGSLAIAFKTIVSNSIGIERSTVRGRPRLLLSDLAKQLVTVASLEGRFGRQHLIEVIPKRVNVGAMVDQPLRPHRLFGTQ